MIPVLLGLLVVAALGCSLGRRCLLVVQVIGRSMEPTLHQGDRLLVCRGRFPLRTGSVIAISMRGIRRAHIEGFPATMVKRLVAGPGDMIPGQPHNAVPAGHVYVVGDAADSYDSRAYGAIPRSAVVGTVVCRLHEEIPAAPAAKG